MRSKQRGRHCDAVLNLTYYFEASLLSRDVNRPRLCSVNKDGGGVNDIPCKPHSDLLW
jgi:hypothetical protein